MIQLTDLAKKEVRRLIEQKNEPGTFLRVGVKGGGCSGLSYEVQFDNRLREHDRSYEVSGVRIVCDSKSFIYLNGLTVDYSTELVGGGFKFINPNATGNCGCGSSFSV